MSFSGGKVPVGRGSHASFGMQLSRRCCWLVASLWAAFSLVGIVASDPSTSSTHNQDQSPNNANAQLRGKRNKHQRSLARFGFSSAFEDSLYTSQEPTREAPCPPQRLHVSQASNVDGADLVNMTVSFTLPYHMCRNVQTAVSYGRGVLPDGTVEDSEVLQFTYNSSSGHQILTPFESDWIHHVTLSDLKAGRETYWYRIMVYTWDTNAFPDQSTASRQPYNAHALAVSPEQDILWARKRKVTSLLVGESKVQVLMTPPLLHQPTSLALVGDLGQTENSTKTMHHIFRATRPLDGSIPVSGLILAGDLSYADGDPRRWPSWLDLMEPLLRSTPLYTVPGNHEIECDQGNFQVFGQYEAYFRNPNRLGPADILPVPEDYRTTLNNCVTSSEFLGHYNYGNAFWGAQHGMIQIIALNSYTSVLPGSPQYSWLDKELQQVDRSITPWLLVFFHCPLHTTFKGHTNEINSILMLRTMEPLFVQYKVNIVVSGHDHAYLRTKPMQGKNAAATGPIYLTLGAGGNREQHSQGFLRPNPENWVVKRDDSEYGFGRLQVPNATHAHLTWVRDGTTTAGIQDSVWLSNQYYL